MRLFVWFSNTVTIFFFKRLSFDKKPACGFLHPPPGLQYTCQLVIKGLAIVAFFPWEPPFRVHANFRLYKTREIEQPRKNWKKNFSLFFFRILLSVWTNLMIFCDFFFFFKFFCSFFLDFEKSNKLDQFWRFFFVIF